MTTDEILKTFRNRKPWPPLSPKEVWNKKLTLEIRASGARRGTEYWNSKCRLRRARSHPVVTARGGEFFRGDAPGFVDRCEKGDSPPEHERIQARELELPAEHRKAL